MTSPIVLAGISLLGLHLFSFFNIWGIRPDLLRDQTIYSIIGILVLFLFRALDIRLFRTNTRVMYAIWIGLLIITLFFTRDIRGSHRWLDLGFFQFQTSEFFRPFFIIIVADILAKRDEISRFLVMKSGLVMILPFILILRQPDLGTALTYLGAWFGMLYMAGIGVLFFIILGTAGIFMAPLLWHFLHDYQRNRIIGFFNPQVDPQGISYNILQSIIAIGSGGFFGKGLGLGTQSRFSFLPEYHTDFAFASLIEQFGFVGGFFVVLLFVVLMYALFRKAFLMRKDRFAFIFISGTALYFCISIFVNCGMNMGLFPVTGIPLPFISYGGSALVSNMILLGMVAGLR